MTVWRKHWTSKTGRRCLRMILLAISVIAYALAPSAYAAPRHVGETRTVAGDVLRITVNQRAKTGDRLIFAETIRTETASAIDIDLIDNSTLAIGEDSQLTLDSFVYDPNRGLVEGAATVITGLMHFSSSGVPMDFVVRTPVATIGVRGTVFDILANQQTTEIAVREGTVDVRSSAGTARVSAGQVYRADRTSGGFLNKPSARLNSSVARMTALLNGSPAPDPSQSSTGETTFMRDTDDATQTASTSSTPSKNDVSSSTARLESIVQGRDTENLSFAQTSKGLVVIELRPDLAPKHVERIKKLIRDGFYDNRKFSFVRPGYVAEIGDVSDTGQTLPAEFSREPVVRGSVGMSRKGDDANSADSKFFIALGRARVLDGNYTIWGRVIEGMKILDTLAAGKPPLTPDKIISLRIAADVMDAK